MHTAPGTYSKHAPGARGGSSRWKGGGAKLLTNDGGSRGLGARVPQGVLLRPICYFLQVRFRKQIMQYTGAARGSIVRVKAKAGVQGAEPLGGGQG